MKHRAIAAKRYAEVHIWRTATGKDQQVVCTYNHCHARLPWQWCNAHPCRQYGHSSSVSDQDWVEKWDGVIQYKGLAL